MKPALKEWAARAFRPNSAMVAPIMFPGVNGQAICDCGSSAFRVGIEQDGMLNNHIRCLECIVCQKKLAIPFFHGPRA